MADSEMSIKIVQVTYFTRTDDLPSPVGSVDFPDGLRRTQQNSFPAALVCIDITHQVLFSESKRCASHSVEVCSRWH